MERKAALLVGFVGIILVAVVGANSEEEAKPPVTEAALTANLESDPNTVHFDRTEYVRALMLGSPMQQETSLVDATGLHVATAEPVPNKNCTDIDLRTTGIGTDEWCLKVTDLEVGAELSGKVKGEESAGGSSNLTLKISERYHFLNAPLLVTLIGLILSLGWTLVTTRWLPRRIPIARLKKAVDDNEQATEGKIDCLTQWVNGLEGTLEAPALLKAIKAIHSSGFSKAGKSRAALAASIKDWPLRPEHSLRKEAQDEAERTDHKIGDFYADDGKAQDEHPAVSLAKLIGIAKALDSRIADARADIDQRVPQALRSNLLEKASYVSAELEESSDASELDATETLVELLEEAVFAAITARPQEREILQHALEENLDLHSFVLQVSPERVFRRDRPRDDSRAALGWKLDDIVDEALTSGVVVFILILIQAVVGLYTVTAAVYLPTHTFGTAWDFVALGAAAFASSSAAAIVGLAAIGEVKSEAT